MLIRRTLTACAATAALTLSVSSWCVRADREPAPERPAAERPAGDRPAGERPAGERGGRQQRLTGDVTSIDGQTLTVLALIGRTFQLRLDEKTRINLASDETVRVMNERGEVVERKKVINGKPADLKPGMRVSVVAVDGVATDVTPLPREADARRPEAAGRDGDKPRDGDQPRDGDARRQQTYAGEISSIDEKQMVVTVRGDAGERKVELKLDATTHVTLPGEAHDGQRPTRIEAKAADLKVGQRVYVVVAEGVAKQIAVTPPRGGGGERAPAEPRRDGDARPAGDRPPAEPRRDGDAPKAGPRDGDAPKAAPRDGDAPANPGRDADVRAGKVSKKFGADELLQGDIAKVDGNTIAVNTIKGRDKASTVASATVVPNAEIIIEGKPGKLADLKAGMPVTVSTANGQAVRIEVPIDLSKPRQ